MNRTKWYAAVTGSDSLFGLHLNNNLDIEMVAESCADDKPTLSDPVAHGKTGPASCTENDAGGARYAKVDRLNGENVDVLVRINVLKTATTRTTL